MEFGDTTAAVKIPKDRKSSLTPVTIKKSLTLMFTKKGDDLRSTYKFSWWATIMDSKTTIDLWLPSFFVKVAHFV